MGHHAEIQKTSEKPFHGERLLDENPSGGNCRSYQQTYSPRALRLKASPHFWQTEGGGKGWGGRVVGSQGGRGGVDIQEEFTVVTALG